MVLIALAMIVFYTLIGASKAGPTSAMVYFRNFTSPLFAVLVGLDLGRTWGFKTVGTTFIFSVGTVNRFEHRRISLPARLLCLGE